MPYRSGLIQSTIGALCAVAFLAHSLTTSKPKQKQIVGLIERSDNSQVTLAERNGRRSTIVLIETTQIFLNEKKLSPQEVQAGRNASVTFRKEAGKLVALQIDVFPTHHDFGTASGTSS